MSYFCRWSLPAWTRGTSGIRQDGGKGYSAYRKFNKAASYRTIHAGMVDSNENVSSGGVIFPFNIPPADTLIG